MVHKPTVEEYDFHSEDSTRLTTTWTRGRRGCQKQESSLSGVSYLIPENHIKKCEPTHQKMKIILSTRAAINFVGSEPSQASLKNDEENIEFLCQDSGIRGCWFGCKILHTSHKCLKVQYHDIRDVDDPGKLEVKTSS